MGRGGCVPLQRRNAHEKNVGVMRGRSCGVRAPRDGIRPACESVRRPHTRGARRRRPEGRDESLHGCRARSRAHEPHEEARNPERRRHHGAQRHPDPRARGHREGAGRGEAEGRRHRRGTYPDAGHRRRNVQHHRQPVRYVDGTHGRGARALRQVSGPD